MYKIGFLKIIHNTKEILFLLGVFFLPINQIINHWFFGLFIAISLIKIGFYPKQIFKKSLLKPLLFISGLFFLIRLISIFHTSDFDLSIKEVTRALPFILYPLAITSIGVNKGFEYSNFYRKVFYTLTFGCITSAVICWGNILMNLEKNAPPMNQLFGWKKSGSYLTEIIDIHPPYLGMLIVSVIIFIGSEFFQNKVLILRDKILLITLVLFLGLFLFNLTARNALFFIGLVALIFFIKEKQHKSLIALLIVAVLAVVVIIKHPSEYYRLKMYHMLGLSKKEDVEDLRFKRLKASYEVFKTAPIIGVGIRTDREMKIEQYKLMDDNIAVKKELNSHNQFFEYLATYGIIGASIFLFVICYGLWFLYKNQYLFYLIIYLNIIVASITESIFQRVLGIQYYSLIAGLVLLHYYCNLKSNNVNKQ